MKVAIAGGGNVGQFIANDLAEAGHEVLIIEQDPGVVGRSAPTLTGPRSTAAASMAHRDACAVLTAVGCPRLRDVLGGHRETGHPRDLLLAKQRSPSPGGRPVNHPKTSGFSRTGRRRSV